MPLSSKTDAGDVTGLYAFLGTLQCKWSFGPFAFNIYIFIHQNGDIKRKKYIHAKNTINNNGGRNKEK